MRALLFLLLLTFFNASYSQNNSDLTDLEKAHINALHQSGIQKSNVKDYAGAIADFDKAIELVPNNYLLHFNRGIVKSLIRDEMGAIADFNKALRSRYILA
jgi:tetratricopeptide (TPR) repeat protein